jgi:hypothetical protein
MGSLFLSLVGALRSAFHTRAAGEGAREARVGQGWGVTDPKGPQG